MKRTILLVVTNRCNLKCTYCYETNKNSHEMSFETAKSIIEREISAKDLKLIEFHGGEPLLNFPLIKDICEWFWKTYPELDTKFFLTTNGTQFNESNMVWFEENHKKIACALSLDGTPEMNKINRGCIIDDTTIDLFLRLWPEQNIKMTISLETLPMLSQGIIYAHEEGFRVSANLAYGPDWKTIGLNDYERELDKLVHYYSEHPNMEPCSIFNGEKLVSILKPYSLTRHCQAGQSFHAYDIDGKKYPCHVFSGNTLKSNEWEKVSCVDFHDDSMFDDPDCKECPIHNICPTCYGMNFIERGSLYSRDKNMCKFIIAEKIATCKLYKHRIMSKDINDISEQEYLILKSIQVISERTGRTI